MLEELRDAGRGLGTAPPLSQGTSPLHTRPADSNSVPRRHWERQEALLGLEHSAVSALLFLYLYSTDVKKPWYDFNMFFE